MEDYLKREVGLLTNIDSCKDELDEFGDEPVQLLRSVLSKPRVRFVGFGESHRWNNPHRRFVRELMPVLSESGFTHLCLEVEPEYQVALENFSDGAIDRTRLEQLMEGAGGSFFDGGRPCPAYFSILEQAKRFGLNLTAVDKNKEKRNWILPEYADDPRERFLADPVTAILSENSKHRVVWFGGANHLYVRNPLPANDLSMAEHLANWLSQSGGMLVSIGGVIFTEASVADLTFERLYPLTVDGLARAVRTADCPELASVLLGEDRRCPWGACFDSRTDQCPGITHGICTQIPMSEIFAGFWDALVFHERDWLRSA